MCNHSLDALSGCQSGRGLFPKDVLQMRTHRTTPGMRPGLKHPPLQPTTWLEKRGKNNKKTAPAGGGGEHDGVIYEGPQCRPRGSAPNPHPLENAEDWVRTRL